MWKETITSSHFYDFDYTLLRWEFDPLISLDREERWVDIPVKLENERHVVRVKGFGTTAQPAFEISSESMEKKEELIQYIYHLFQWDKNLEEVYQYFMDTNLEALFREHPGTPIVKDFNLYDCLMKVIIHQQLNMKFAYTLSTRFVHTFGRKEQGVWFYPTAAEVAEIPYESLRELQFSQRKAEYVIDTSRMIATGGLDLEDLEKNTDEEVMKQLVKIRGIGPWTAENWLMFGLGRENLFPKADIGIQNALKLYFGKEKKPSYEQMEQWSKEWEPYLSYASLTLWRSIEG